MNNPKRKYEPWTIKEIQYLKENYRKKTASELAKDLERTVDAVKKRLSVEGIRNFKYQEYAVYDGDELLVIGTAKECAEHLGIKVGTVLRYITPSHKKRLSKRNAIKL